jgi:hypothetical protein
MLIIAIPKSASTSLMDTLGRLHKKPAEQKTDLIANNPISDEFKFIHKYHRDMRELNIDIIKKLSNKNSLYKQHILPTKNNMELLKNTKKIILLRKTKEVIIGYKREFNKTNDAYNRKDFRVCNTDKDWIDKAKKIGLFDDLFNFNQRWKKDDSDKLIIYYDDLIKNPKKEINKIEKYFGLPQSKKVVLSKKRYTRSNKEYIP